MNILRLGSLKKNKVTMNYSSFNNLPRKELPGHFQSHLL